MADNLTTQDSDLSTIPTGTIIATDKIGGVDYQRVKLTWGVDGAAVDASATDPLPVVLTSTTITGTVAATQSGTWNVTNISGTVSLPTGAATAAKQPALGTAGSASADVITVQGVASMTALKVDNSAVTQPTKIAFQTTKALTNASISASSSGENTLVSGTAAQTIRVHRIVLVAASAVSVSFKDAASGTSLTGAMPLTANGAMVLEASGGEPLFVSATAGAFILNLSAAVTVTGFIQYTKS